MTIRRRSVVGDSLALIIERPTLERLGITEDTPLEITTDAETLVIRPLRNTPLMERALASADRLMEAHEPTYDKLAK